MNKLDLQEVLINKVFCNIMRRMTGSVNKSFPLEPEQDGLFDMNTVMKAADQEYEIGEAPYFDKLESSDKETVLLAVERELSHVLKRFNS